VILYHGSYTAVEAPDIWRSREKLDFGRGFYTTPFRGQAVKWTSRFTRRYGKRVVSVYEIDETAIRENLRLLEFASYSEEWLNFVTLCRMGAGNNGGYDVIIGSVANDRVFDALEAYFNGFLDKAVAIQRLRYEQPNLQYCFVNQDAMDRYLRFVSSEVIV
jgi:hypothetical protein